MPPSRKNPYRIKNYRNRKFRGVFSSDPGSVLPPAYVDSPYNAASPRIGQLTAIQGFSLHDAAIPEAGSFYGAEHSPMGFVCGISDALYFAKLYPSSPYPVAERPGVTLPFIERTTIDYSDPWDFPDMPEFDFSVDRDTWLGITTTLGGSHVYPNVRFDILAIAPDDFTPGDKDLSLWMDANNTGVQSVDTFIVTILSGTAINDILDGDNAWREKNGRTFCQIKGVFTGRISSGYSSLGFVVFGTVIGADEILIIGAHIKPPPVEIKFWIENSLDDVQKVPIDDDHHDKTARLEITLCANGWFPLGGRYTGDLSEFSQEFEVTFWDDTTSILAYLFVDDNGDYIDLFDDPNWENGKFTADVRMLNAGLYSTYWIKKAVLRVKYEGNYYDSFEVPASWGEVEFTAARWDDVVPGLLKDGWPSEYPWDMEEVNYLVQDYELSNGLTSDIDGEEIAQWERWLRGDGELREYRMPAGAYVRASTTNECQWYAEVGGGYESERRVWETNDWVNFTLKEDWRAYGAYLSLGDDADGGYWEIQVGYHDYQRFSGYTPEGWYAGTQYKTGLGFPNDEQVKISTEVTRK